MVCKKIKEELDMEKIIWLRNSGSGGINSLPEVNKLLKEGWKVKMLSSCATGDYASDSHVYIVLEKDR